MAVFVFSLVLFDKDQLLEISCFRSKIIQKSVINLLEKFKMILLLQLLVNCKYVSASFFLGKF